jgi:hypothetical protein
MPLTEMVSEHVLHFPECGLITVQFKQVIIQFTSIILFNARDCFLHDRPQSIGGQQFEQRDGRLCSALCPPVCGKNSCDAVDLALGLREPVSAFL